MSASEANRLRCLVLLKGEHQYLFRVEVGLEEHLLEAVSAMAANDKLNFDWEDAAFFNRLIAEMTGGRAGGGGTGEAEEAETVDEAPRGG